MKACILAGGLGTRLQEETALKPKPMVTIGNRPILWHIMKGYEKHGVKDFSVALGYKGEEIKSYFLSYRNQSSSIRLDLATGNVLTHESRCEPWTLDLLDTGENTMTGGRVQRLLRHANEPVFLTYGDGVCDVNFSELLAFHRSHGKLATLTAVRPAARFGKLEFEGDQVSAFLEKPQTGEGWINGGFFILEPEVADYIAGDDITFEQQPLQQLAAEGELMAYRHNGFWQCMDTLRDVRLLNQLWAEGKAPWKSWSDAVPAAVEAKGVKTAPRAETRIVTLPEKLESILQNEDSVNDPKTPTGKILTAEKSRIPSDF